jgi:20S proteasome subunit alpha 3
MYAGYDDVIGYQLYSSDPSGNYYSWKAHATGQGTAAGSGSSGYSTSINPHTILKSDYDEEMSFQDGLKLAVKVIYKDIDTHDPKGDRFEVNYITKVDGKLVHKVVPEDTLNTLIEEIKKQEEEEEKKQ